MKFTLLLISFGICILNVYGANTSQNISPEQLINKGVEVIKGLFQKTNRIAQSVDNAGNQITSATQNTARQISKTQQDLKNNSEELKLLSARHTPVKQIVISKNKNDSQKQYTKTNNKNLQTTSYSATNQNKKAASANYKEIAISKNHPRKIVVKKR